MDLNRICFVLGVMVSNSTFAASMDRQDQKCAKIAVGNYDLGNPMTPWMPEIGGANKDIQIKLLEKKGKILSFLMNEKGDASGNVTAIYMKKIDCKEIYKMRFSYDDVMALHPEVMRDLNSRY